MARCERNKANFGVVVYKRHKFKSGQCSCGVAQQEHLRSVANRREKRRQTRKSVNVGSLGSGTGI